MTGSDDYIKQQNSQLSYELSNANYLLEQLIEVDKNGLYNEFKKGDDGYEASQTHVLWGLIEKIKIHLNYDEKEESGNVSASL